MNVCPICDNSNVELIESVRPKLHQNGMMFPVLCHYLKCTDCEIEFAGKNEINFNAKQAHLYLNQYCDLDEARK